MQFEGWVLDDAGKRMLAWNVLQNVSADTIRHVYSTSADGGKTWAGQERRTVLAAEGAVMSGAR